MINSQHWYFVGNLLLLLYDYEGDSSYNYSTATGTAFATYAPCSSKALIDFLSFQFYLNISINETGQSVDYCSHSSM